MLRFELSRVYLHNKTKMKEDQLPKMETLARKKILMRVPEQLGVRPGSGEQLLLIPRKKTPATTLKKSVDMNMQSIKEKLRIYFHVQVSIKILRKFPTKG